MNKTLFSERSDATQCIHECPCQRPDTMSLHGLRYTFLNQCSNSWALHAREWLELAFQNYPSDSKNDLRERFKSKINKNHRGAYFELISHALLMATGASIEVQPKFDGWGCKPDFLIQSGDKKFGIHTIIPYSTIGLS